MLAKHVRNIGSKTFGYFVSTRGIQQNVNCAVNNQFEPVQINMPWGKIEGKLWGSRDKQPILTLHGWMDNAGSFDNLAPLLLKNSSILAIDLPGHGLSSWLPPGIPLDESRSVETMRRIVKYFGWNKVKLMGHSMGSILCFNYTRLFPEETQFVVAIDSLAFIPNMVLKHMKKQAQAIDKLINFEAKVTNNPPSYPEDVAVQKWIKATIFKSLDVPAAKTLMIRGAKRKEDGTYYYTRDFRLSIEGFNSCYTMEYIREMAQVIKCPYLAIKASDTPFINRDEYLKNIANVLKETSEDFCLVELKGNHHLHMITPEMCANVINPFLEKYNI